NMGLSYGPFPCFTGGTREPLRRATAICAPRLPPRCTVQRRGHCALGARRGTCDGVTPARVGQVLLYIRWVVTILRMLLPWSAGGPRATRECSPWGVAPLPCSWGLWCRGCGRRRSSHGCPASSSISCAVRHRLGRESRCYDATPTSGELMKPQTLARH